MKEKRNGIALLDNFVSIYNRCYRNDSRNKLKHPKMRWFLFTNPFWGGCREKLHQEKLQFSLTLETI